MRGYTCPDIDRNLSSIEDYIKDSVYDILIDNTPEIYHDSREFREYSYDKSLDLYNFVKDSFENVRQTNIELRESAEEEIEKLDEEINNLKDDYENKIAQLKSEIERLEEQLDV